MAFEYIYKKCSRCNGTGIIYKVSSVPPPPHPSDITCPHCKGAKEVYWGKISKEKPEQTLTQTNYV